jgi:hypothetical protein
MLKQTVDTTRNYIGNMKESFTLTQNKDSLNMVCKLKIFPVITYQNKKAK